MVRSVCASCNASFGVQISSQMLKYDQQVLLIVVQVELCVKWILLYYDIRRSLLDLSKRELDFMRRGMGRE